MADRIVVAILNKVDDRDCLSFRINGSKTIIVDLNSDDQTHLKELFFALLQELFEDDITLNLEFEDGYDQTNIFANIAREYIKALNEEVKTVKQSLPQK